MFRKIVRYVLMIWLLWSNNSYTQNKSTNPYKSIDPYELLEHIYRDIDAGTLNRDKEKKYAQLYRHLVFQKRTRSRKISESVLETVHYKLLANILSEFPSITQEEYVSTDYSTGCALIMKGQQEKALDILIREGELLSSIAQCTLTRLYVMPEDGFVQFDPRIFAFFKEMALDNDSLSQFYYGVYLLYGIGVEQNTTEGLKYIDCAAQAGFSRASVELADYYDKQNDMANEEKYLRLGVEQESTAAMYKLALFDIRRKEQDEALSLCIRALDLDPECYGAKFALANMYLEGRGLERDDRKGFLLMQEVDEHVDGEVDPKLKCFVCFSLGMLYEKGIGIEESPAKAQEYFNKSEEFWF